jgi:hypothetical protein
MVIKNGTDKNFTLHSLWWLNVIAGNEAVKLAFPNFGWMPRYYDSCDVACTYIFFKMVI